TQITLGQGGSTFGLEDKVAALPILSERHGQHPIKQVRRFFSDMNVIAPAPSELSGFSDGESTVLAANGSNVAECLNTLLIRYPAAYASVIDYLKAHIPDISSFRNAPRGETGHQLIVEFEGAQSGRLSLDFDKLSDGEKCFFLSAVVVALNEKARPVFCMWDEPDNHLSLPEIGHFMTGLRRMTNQNGQFIATSHHPETIRRFSEDSTLVFTRKSHLEPTVVRSLGEFDYRGDLIEALIRDEVIG
ncbi:MAG: AAA family ATPase, partial [Gemmataceae bacterium]